MRILNGELRIVLSFFLFSPCQKAPESVHLRCCSLHNQSSRSVSGDSLPLQLIHDFSRDLRRVSSFYREHVYSWEIVSLVYAHVLRIPRRLCLSMIMFSSVGSARATQHPSTRTLPFPLFSPLQLDSVQSSLPKWSFRETVIHGLPLALGSLV
jgi:hypothetical protein